MKKIKMLIAGAALSLMASNANAWLLDGSNYVMGNAGFSSGTIKENTISSQNIGLEIGKNFSEDWYSALFFEYSVYAIEDEYYDIGLRAGTAAIKVGYRPTSSTLIYAMGGLSGEVSSFGPTLGAGARWEVLSQVALYAEYRRTSVSTKEGVDNTYVINAGHAGIQLYFRY